MKQLEQIAWALEQLSPQDQDRFRSYAQRSAEAYPSPEEADKIQSLIEGLFPP